MKNMGCNFVSLNIQDYTFDPVTGDNCYNNANFWNKLDNIILWCKNQGLYLNLRFWATSGACQHGISSGDLGHFMTVDHTWNEWLNIANTISYRYRNYNHIMYEPLSEGRFIPLAEYVGHMQNAIDTIRANRADAIINVQAAGSGDWETMTFNMPSIGRTNIVYSSDPYGEFVSDNSITGIYNKQVIDGGRGPASILAAGGCVIFSEFGGKFEGNYDSWGSTYTKNFMAMCDQYGISGYNAWRWCTTAEGPTLRLLNDWNGNLSPYGNDIKTYYSARR